MLRSSELETHFENLYSYVKTKREKRTHTGVSQVTSQC